MKQIFTFRVYISHLHNQLHKLYIESQQNDNDTSTQIVFRGKPLSGSVLQQLIDNEGGLISMHGFLSTTSDRKVALKFAGDEQVNNGYRPVLFHFHINTTIKQPYADISKYSAVPDEMEILFSFGTIWKIQSVNYNQNPCVVELTSSDGLGSQLTELLEKRKREGCNLSSLGDILYELGDNAAAEWFYRKMLEQDSVLNQTRGKLYYMIGRIRFEEKDYPVALENFEKSASLLEPSNDAPSETGTIKPLYKCDSKSHLIAIHSNMGFLHAENGRFDAAFGCYEKALRAGGSNLELATVHNNFGLLYFRYGKYNEACCHHKKATELIANSHPWWIEFKKNFNFVDRHLKHIETSLHSSPS
jgi:tetratricopeptide (TPR) repeat protein